MRLSSRAATPNHIDGAKYLSTADNCQTNCRAQPPRELVVLEWSQHGRELVMVVSIMSFFQMCPFVIEHSGVFIRSQELHA